MAIVLPADQPWSTLKASVLRADLGNTIIVLPRMVPQVNDLSPDAFRTDDPRDWNVSALASLVGGFLNRTGAATLPSLPEWSTLPDKVGPSMCTNQGCYSRHVDSCLPVKSAILLLISSARLAKALLFLTGRKRASCLLSLRGEPRRRGKFKRARL